jgi:hypothetical protein
MKTCFATKNCGEALKTYQLLKQYNLHPDSITYTTMVKGLINNKSKEGLTGILKDSLYNTIILSHSLYVEVVVFLNSFEDGLEEANNIVKELSSFDIIVDPKETVNGSSYNNSENHKRKNYYNKANNNKKSNGTLTNYSDNKINYLFNSYKFKTDNKRNENKPKFYKNNENSDDNMGKKTINSYGHYNKSKLAITYTENSLNFQNTNNNDNDKYTDPNSKNSYYQNKATPSTANTVNSNINRNSWRKVDSRKEETNLFNVDSSKDIQFNNISTPVKRANDSSQSFKKKFNRF